MLITNARIIAWGATKRILENHALYIEGDLIVDLGPSSELQKRYPQAKAAYLYHKAARRDPRRMSGATVAEMAVTNNAALAKVFFPQAPICVLAPRAFAGIIFVDYHPSAMTWIRANSAPIEASNTLPQ